MSANRNAAGRCLAGVRARELGLAAALAAAAGAPAAKADQLANAPPPSWASEPASTEEALAPIGVFGANMPGAGHLIVTESTTYARSDGNLIGTTSVTPGFIVGNILSDRTPLPGNHLLRVVPLNGQAAGEFITTAYGVNDSFTLAVTGGYAYKSKELLTYKGLSGETPLGTSSPYTNGVTDTTVAGVYRLYKDPINRINVSLGIGVPTGGIDNTWIPLSPAGAHLGKVAVYGMQEGYGSLTALPGIAYVGRLNQWAWGLSYRGVLPLGYNVDGWRFGNLQAASAWAGYNWVPGFMTTLRLGAVTQGPIQGASAAILGYAQGNVPQFYGGQWVDLNLGASVSGRYFGAPRLTIQAEAGIPLYQNLNGPQAAANWSGVLRAMYKF